MVIEPSIEEYGTQIGRLLQQAQDASSDKQRLCASLYNIHNAFTREYEKGLRDFFRCLFNRAFPAFKYKKGDVNADRILKFLACYLDHCNTKHLEEANEKQEDEDEDEDSDDDDEDNAAEVKAAHFTKNIVKEVVFPGCEAGDKNVRFRTVQFMTFVAGSLQSIDEQLMISLQQKLVDRLKDRESAVRSHAAIALGVLSHRIETGEGFEEQRVTTDESSSWRPLLEALREDSIAEVRRSIISSIVINKATRPILLDTVQDEDASVRRAVYTVLRSNVENMTHPTRFSRPERDATVHRALADQHEPAVQAAAEQLLVSWLRVGPRKRPDTDLEEPTPTILIETFISFFDPSTEHGLEIAEGSMRLVIKGDPQFFKAYLVAGSWQLENMNYQFVFAYRMFIVYLQEKQEAQMLEDMLPDIQPIAGAIQSIYNEMELEVQSTAWMLVELLKLGAHLDYSNVVMKADVRMLMRELLLYGEVPEDLLRPLSHLLVITCDTNSSLLELLVEIIETLRTRAPVAVTDNTSDVEPPSDKPDLSLEDQTKSDCVDKRCLTICIAVLESMNRLVGGHAARKAIKAIISDLISPMLLKSEPDLAFAALHCLGLCSMICLETADRYIAYFEEKYFSSTIPEARVVMIKSYIDVVIEIQGTPVFTKHRDELIRIMGKLLAQLPDEGGSEVGALICQGIAKFFLIGFVDDEDTLKLLFKAMISPSSANNPNLRQSMQVFFSELGRIHPSTQRRLQRIFTHIYLDACEDRRKYEQFESLDLKEKVELVSSQSIAAMFERWTHPEFLTKNAKLKAVNDSYLSLHLHMATDVLRSLFGITIKISKEDKRVLCHLLNRLYLPPSPDALQVKSIKFLIDNLRNRRPLNDRESNTALDRFDASIVKLYPRHIESMSEEDLRKYKELTDLFAFLDDMIPLDDDDEFEPANAGDKRQRRGTADTGSDGEYRSHSAPATRSRSKRRRLSGDVTVVKEEQQDVKIENDDDGSLPSAKPKGKARRTATSPEIISLLTEDEDEDAPPVWSNKKTRGTSSVEPITPETESVVDRDLSKLLDPLSIAAETDGVNMTMDSIMDESDFSGDSEDEVSGLLSTNAQ